jgi:hypothetical protein
MIATIPLTQHASERLQQRGIRLDALDDLLAYGTPEFDHHGGCIYYLDKRGRRNIARDFGKAGARKAESLGRLFAVVAADGAVITVGHRYQRIHRH